MDEHKSRLSGSDPEAEVDSPSDCANVFDMRNSYNEMLATGPHYHSEQLMRPSWKVFLPVSLLFVVLVSGWLMLTRYGV